MKKGIIIIVLSFFFVTSLSAQVKERTLSGIISTKGSPKSGVIVYPAHHPENRDTTNEQGEYKLRVTGQVHQLHVVMSDSTKPIHAHLHHHNARKFNFDTEQDIGYFTWKANSNFQFSNSLFSTYQSNGNNNNISTLLIDLTYRNNYHKKRLTVDTDTKMLFGQSLTRVPIRAANSTQAELYRLINKSADLISGTSKLGYNMRHHVYLSTLVNFQTQATKTYADPYAREKGEQLQLVSDFLSPATFNLGIGLDYKPNRFFSLYVSALNLDAQIVRNENLRQNYGIFEANGISKRMGAFLSMDWNHTFRKKVFYSTKLQLATNYRKNPQFPEAERPGSIDVQMFKHSIAYKFNKHISLSFAAVFRYDEDIKFNLRTNDEKTGKPLNIKGPRIQYFQNLGIGVAYNFQNHEHRDVKKKK